VDNPIRVEILQKSHFGPSDTLTDFKDRFLLEKLTVPQLFRKFSIFIIIIIIIMFLKG